MASQAVARVVAKVVRVAGERETSEVVAKEGTSQGALGTREGEGKGPRRVRDGELYGRVMHDLQRQKMGDLGMQTAPSWSNGPSALWAVCLESSL